MERKEYHADKHVFYICLAISIALFIGGFFCPPMGIIDGSVLTAGGILFGFAALAVVGQNLANGKDVVFTHENTEVKIGDIEQN
jgi:small neutral amino acid transporter SnatA (MarC family)